MSDSTEIIQIKDLQAFYGDSQALYGVNLNVRRGELVALVGRNGAGRSTVLKSIMGLIGRRSGSIMIDGRETIQLSSHKIARLGMGYCPEDRGIFASLTVEENLLLPPKIAEGGMTLTEIYELFPNLKERLSSHGTRLSGGEQQMLAMARILRTGAKILLLDEITEGLAPVIVQTLARTVHLLKRKGFTIILVEQNFNFSASLADRYYVLEHGKVVEMIRGDELEEKRQVLHSYLSV